MRPGRQLGSPQPITPNDTLTATHSRPHRARARILKHGEYFWWTLLPTDLLLLLGGLYGEQVGCPRPGEGDLLRALPPLQQRVPAAARPQPSARQTVAEEHHLHRVLQQHNM